MYSTVYALLVSQVHCNSAIYLLLNSTLYLSFDENLKTAVHRSRNPCSTCIISAVPIRDSSIVKPKSYMNGGWTDGRTDTVVMMGVWLLARGIRADIPVSADIVYSVFIVRFCSSKSCKSRLSKKGLRACRRQPVRPAGPSDQQVRPFCTVASRTAAYSTRTGLQMMCFLCEDFYWAVRQSSAAQNLKPNASFIFLCVG